ncbi:isoprenylcysteine carboxylmethyltransferase family protein [bacterium]|nr:isoprenylcysteine carboxylmethyltransferase family protein [bacterium]
MSEQPANQTDHRPKAAFLELKLPPVLVGAVVFALQWLLAEMVPSWNLSIPMGRFFAAFYVALGVCVALYGVLSFRLASTTVNPHTPHKTSALVCSGLYSRTRNPMYLGMALVLSGWAVYLANPVGFGCIPLFIAYMNAFQIKPEERHLRERFPNDFDSYLAKTRRWI